jgi:truncated hemoglobin YjbI
VRDLIYTVIDAFYEKAMDDVLIGYHFYKFGRPDVLEDHLQRITSFWELQLTGSTTRTLDAPFQLLFTHLQLKIKRGELGRWIILFHQTLDSLEEEFNQPEIQKLTEIWKQKIAFFEQRFISHPQMFR